jgi:hypothetical protein
MRIARVSAIFAIMMTAASFSTGCSDQTCSPGSYQFCAGASGCHGVQTCAADGTLWGRCDCGDGLYGTGGGPSEADAAVSNN